jgi:hypothetical protein
MLSPSSATATSVAAIGKRINPAAAGRQSDETAMHRHSLPLITAGTIALLCASSAFAGSPGCGVCGPVQSAPVVEVIEVPVKRHDIYVVNQGPVHSGPGSFLVPSDYTDRVAPRDYPYVGVAVFPMDERPVYRRYRERVRHDVRFHTRLRSPVVIRSRPWR